MLESDHVLQRILERRGLLLEVSPFLLFNVLLRQTLPRRRTALERKVINYLADRSKRPVKPTIHVPVACAQGCRSPGDIMHRRHAGIPQ